MDHELLKILLKFATEYGPQGAQEFKKWLKRRAIKRQREEEERKRIAKLVFPDDEV